MCVRVWTHFTKHEKQVVDMVCLNNTWVWSGALLSLLEHINNNEEWPLEVRSLMQNDHMHANHVGSKLSCMGTKGTTFRAFLPFA